MSVSCSTVLSCLLLFSTVLPAGAATESLGGVSPGAVQKHSQDTREFYQLENLLQRPAQDESRLQKMPEDEEAAPAEKKPEASFLLRKVVTNPSNVLTAEEIAEVTAAYEGRIVSIDELFQLVEAINKLYADHQVLTAKAFLPPQKINDGLVEIRLVESRLGKMSIEGNADTSAPYISGHFSLQPGELLALDKLEEELRRFNRLNDVTIKAELHRGEIPLTTDCVLTVTEPSPYSFLLYADNTGQKDTGRERIGAVATVRSVLGRRDPLSLAANASEGTRALLISYSIPVNSQGTRLGASYNVNTIKVIDGIFESLDITGESSDVDLKLSHPLKISSEVQIGAQAGFHWKKSTTDFDDVNFFLTKVRSAYAGFDYQKIGEGSVTFGRGEVIGGFDDFGGDRSFFKINLDLAYRKELSYGFGTLLRGAGQIADVHLLPAMEQFQLGGMATVRGYSEGIRLGDDGYLASWELYTPMPSWKVLDHPLGQMVKGVIFVDHGGAFPYKGKGESNDHTDYLTGAGAGLLFQFTQYLGGRAYLAAPLGEREEHQDSVKVHFFLQSIFF